MRNLPFPKRRPWPFALLAACLLAGPLLRAQPVFTSPESSPYVTDEGALQLVWSEEGVEGERSYEVRRWAAGEGGEGVYVYEGQDTASYLSGLPEGDYELRVRSRPVGGEHPEWSEDHLLVKVEYIDSRLLVGLMSVGLVTFVAIVLSIALGHRAARGYEASES